MRRRRVSASVAVCLLAALASLSFLLTLIPSAEAAAAAAGGAAGQGGDCSSGSQPAPGGRGCRRAGLGGRQRGAFGRLSQPTPQQRRQWHSNAGRLLPAAEVPAAGTAGIQHTSNGVPAAVAAAAAAATSDAQESRRRLQQQPQNNNGTAADSSSSNSSVNGAESSNSSGSDLSNTVSFCPAWSGSAAVQSGQVEVPADRQGSSSSSRALAVNFTADFNAYASGGATAADRLSIIAVAAADAVNAALGNGSAAAAAAAAAASDIAVAPGLFDPLTVDELLAVYQFLYDQQDLNLTLIETAVNNDNFVAWIELAPHNKQAALKWLDSQPPGSTSGGTSASREPVGQMPARYALALVLQGRHNPPRVVRLRVGPLPQPTSWAYEPLGPAGQLEAGWLQRPYSIQEASAVGTLVDAAMARLGLVLRAHLDGYWYSPAGNCTNKCLTYSMGAPFGSGPSQPPGTVINPPRRGASNSNTDSDSSSNASGDSKGVAQRWLWAFFYRDLEGHHLHTVGLELQIDASALDPADWRVKHVWFADRMWPSVDDLLAAHNTSTPGGRSSGGSSAAGAEDLAKFRMHPITASDAVFSTFVPRFLGDADGSAATSALPGAKPGSGPPLQYEPGGRRFKLSGYAVEDWMGWSFSIGHQPTTGINFWDIRFRGERIIWELSLQEAYAAYGGASPMQSHVQYLDSHFGLGSAYKELVAGIDCPLNAAFLDLSLAFMSGPLIIPNAVCIFEVSTGRPLLRHFADAGGGPAYYGAVTDTTLVVRGISTIYNYDYVEDLVLHLDGSLQVAVHTTGYPQSAWFSWERHGNSYGYPFWYDDGGTIHDHQLHWKVDLDIAGTSNSVRFNQVLAREIQPDNGFPGSSVPWYSKRLQQVIPEREAEAALFWNGSSKAHPERRAPVALQFIINEDQKNKWGSARGYRIQHTQSTNQVLPDNFTATAAFSWTFYQTAVTRREESEPSSSSQLNQALPFAPALDFQAQLLATAASQVSNNNSSKQADSGKSNSASQPDLGDPIRRQDLVLWVTSGLQHVPGSEDAPVTPTTGPAIGFWLRPFNFFNESAAASQPDLVYIPVLTRADAQAAADAAAEDDANASAFSLAPVIAHRIRGNASSGSGSGAGARGAVSSALPVVGRDAVEVVTLREREGLLAARRGVQPYVGVTLAQTCIPSFAVTPFNGTYTQLVSGTSSNSSNASGAAANAGSNSGGNAAAGSGGGGGSTGRASSSGGGATLGNN